MSENWHTIQDIGRRTSLNSLIAKNTIFVLKLNENIKKHPYASTFNRFT
jgi:hypothetical protein